MWLVEDAAGKERFSPHILVYDSMECLAFG